MTNVKALKKWSRRRKRLRLFHLVKDTPKDTFGRLVRRQKLARLLTTEAVEYMRHLKEELR